MVSGTGYIMLFDSSYNLMYEQSFSNLGRYEMKMIGGSARIYNNGADIYHSGALAVNPAYVAWGGYFSGSTGYDDIVYGDTESNYVIGMPETNAGGSYTFLLKKSIINPADRGLANGNTYVVVNANNMTTTFSKNNSGTETMYLKYIGTGVIVGCQSVSGYTGSVSWPLAEDIFNNANASYGSYTAYLSGSPATLSPTSIQYVASGASMAWGSHTYSTSDTGSYTWSISSDVWALSTSGYSFSAKVIDVYGATVSTTPITTQTGTGSYTFSSSNAQGVYYIALIANNGGSDAWIAYDYTTLTGYFALTGTVNDAVTAHSIAVANVSITQGGLASNTVTTTGAYTTAGMAFGSGGVITINATATGYKQYRFVFTPLAAKSVARNITMYPNTITVSGVGLYGVANDTTYGNPISGVTVALTNTTYGETHTALTNNAGMYIFDNSRSGILTSGYCYLVSTSILHYTQVYPTSMKCVV